MRPLGERLAGNEATGTPSRSAAARRPSSRAEHDPVELIQNARVDSPVELSGPASREGEKLREIPPGQHLRMPGPFAPVCVAGCLEAEAQAGLVAQQGRDDGLVGKWPVRGRARLPAAVARPPGGGERPPARDRTRSSPCSRASAWRRASTRSRSRTFVAPSPNSPQSIHGNGLLSARISAPRSQRPGWVLSGRARTWAGRY